MLKSPQGAKSNVASSNETETAHRYDPKIPTPGIYNREMPKYIIRSNIPVSCSILYNSKIWKHIKCSSTGKYIHVCCDILIMVHQSAGKINELEPHIKTWLFLRNI